MNPRLYTVASMAVLIVAMCGASRICFESGRSYLRPNNRLGRHHQARRIQSHWVNQVARVMHLASGYLLRPRQPPGTYG